MKTFKWFAVAPALFILCCALALPAEAQPSATAAKCKVTDVRQVGLEKLVKMGCPDNRLSLEVWLPPREKAKWLTKDIWTNVIPTGMGQDVHVSPGRAPRSDYSKPKPVHVLVLSTNAVDRATGTLLSLTFH